MTTTGLATIDTAPQVFAEWLNALCHDLGWRENGRAYLLLRSTLHALRDFLTIDEAAQLAAQLPVLVRGVYYDGWDPSGTPVKPRNKSDFLARIEAHFDKTPLDDTERAVMAVFDLLERRMSEGEIAQVRHALRRPLQELWD